MKTTFFSLLSITCVIVAIILIFSGVGTIFGIPIAVIGFYLTKFCKNKIEEDEEKQK